MQTDPAIGVGHIPSGLFIVCSYDQDSKKIDGYLASWIQQVSFKPLLLTLAVKPGRPAYDDIKNKKKFSINIISEADKSFMKHFWKGYDPNLNPFKEIPHEIKDGVVIMKGAKSVIECKMIEALKLGDHELVIAEVQNTYLLNTEAKPLVHVRKSGLDY